MTYRPTEFEVNNSGGIGCDIYIDPESLLESTMFFKINQDSEGITVSLECLENLLACANELLQAWRDCVRQAQKKLQLQHDLITQLQQFAAEKS